MPNPALDQVVEEVKALTRDEQQQLWKWLCRELAIPQTSPTEEEFEQELMRAGLLTRARTRVTDSTTPEDFEPITIEGKPLSETIIEERR